VRLLWLWQLPRIFVMQMGGSVRLHEPSKSMSPACLLIFLPGRQRHVSVSVSALEDRGAAQEDMIVVMMAVDASANARRRRRRHARRPGEPPAAAAPRLLFRACGYNVMCSAPVVESAAAPCPAGVMPPPPPCHAPMWLPPPPPCPTGPR